MISPKLLLSLAIFIAAVGVLLVSVVRLSQPGILPTRLITQSSPEMAADLNEVLGDQDENVSAWIDYHLPSPGILPDHPLYWLKMIRDRGQLWVSSTPQDRLQLTEEFANKRLAAGYALIRNGEESLGISTITKAEKYLVQAAKLAQEPTITSFEKEQLAKVFLYHQQTLTALLDMIADPQKSLLNEYILLNQQTYEQYWNDSNASPDK